jgi:hypothetical protein
VHDTIFRCTHVVINETSGLPTSIAVLRGVVTASYANQQRSVSSGRHPRLGGGAALQGQFPSAATGLYGGGELPQQATGQSPRPRCVPRCGASTCPRGMYPTTCRQWGVGMAGRANRANAADIWVSTLHFPVGPDEPALTGAWKAFPWWRIVVWPGWIRASRLRWARARIQSEVLDAKDGRHP